MAEDRYITIPIRFITELGLKGNELMIYSMIYGFSQDGESRFQGSASYIAQVLGMTRRTVFNVLNKLVEDGRIIKHNKKINGVVFCDYSVKIRGGKKISPPKKTTTAEVVKNFHRGGEKFSPHNIIDNNISSSSKLKIKEIFDFWNEGCLERLKLDHLSEERAEKIKERLKEFEGETLDEKVAFAKSLIQKVWDVPFLNGSGKDGWKANFDWLFKDEANWRKVWEGYYDDYEEESLPKSDKTKKELKEQDNETKHNRRKPITEFEQEKDDAW